MKRFAVAAAAAFLVLVAIAAAVTAMPSRADAHQGRSAPDDPVVDAAGPIRSALASLVADGTLTPAQAEAVVMAIGEAATVRKAQRRPGWRGAQAGFRIGVLLGDGVIDAGELAGLPADHPLRRAEGPATSYLDDGELSIDELRAIRDKWRSTRP